MVIIEHRPYTLDNALSSLCEWVKALEKKVFENEEQIRNLKRRITKSEAVDGEVDPECK